MTAIFISHSSADNAAAAEMKAWLEGQGHTSLFLDFDPEAGIKSGSGWEQTLYRQLRQCQAVIALLTPGWLASKWCFAELVQARERGKAIFPVKVQSCEVGGVFSDIQAIDLTAEPEDGYRRLRIGLLEWGLDPQDVFDWDPKRPPYPGLLAFQEQDAAIFFGRGEEILKTLETLDALRRQGREAARFALLLGASGSGKSSLARAGVIPRLKKKPAEWLPVPPFRPQQNPLDELAMALATAFEAHGRPRGWSVIRTELHAAAGRNPVDGLALLNLARDLAIAAQQPETTVLLTIDQVEELFGYSPPEATTRFLRVLRAALEAADRRLMAIGTLRSDFFGEFQNHPVLRDGEYPQHVRYQPVPVDPMPLPSFPEIIRGPAGLSGLQLDDRLVEAMVNDTGTRDALPLLAFTLRRLYERYGADGRMALEEYENLGRLEGAIREEAQRVIAETDPAPEDLEVLHAAFVPTMVRISAEGGYARRRARFDELPRRALPLLRRFVDARLLVTDRDPQNRETIEVAHEALFHTWPLLGDWLKEDQDKLGLLQTIQRSAEEWNQGKRRDDLLIHRDGRLKDAEALLANPRFSAPEASVERSYLDACGAAQRAREAAEKGEQERRIRDAERIAEEQKRTAAAQKRTARAYLVGLAVAVLVTGLAVWQYFEAKQETQRAERETQRATTELRRAVETDSRRLAQIAERYLQEGRPHQAIMVAREAFGPLKENLRFQGRSYVWQAADVLHRALAARPILRKIFRGHTYIVNMAAFSHDGKRIVTAGTDGRMFVLDARTLAIERLLIPNRGTVGENSRNAGEDVAWAAFSPDSEHLATANEDGSVRIFRVHDGKQVVQFQAHPGAVGSLSFTPDGSNLLTASGVSSDRDDIHQARLWNTADGMLVRNIIDKAECCLGQGVVSPDGRRIAVAEADDVSVWDARSGKKLLRLGGVSGPMAFSADGSRLAARGDEDKVVRVWDAESGKEVLTLRGHEADIVTSVAFSPDGRHVLTTGCCLYAEALVWDARSGARVASLLGHEESPQGGVRGIRSAAFSPDGRYIVTAGQDHTVRLWEFTPAAPARLLGDEGNPRLFQFSPDGSLIAAIGDGAVLVWRPGQNTPVRLPSGDADRSGFVFSPDRSQLLVLSDNDDDPSYDARTLERVGSFSLDVDLDRLRCFSPLSFSPDSSRIVGCSGEVVDGNWRGDLVRIWDAHSGKELMVLKGHYAEAATFVGQGDRVMTTGDGVIRFWDGADGSQLVQIGVHEGTGAFVRAAASPDGALVASGTDWKWAGVWDTHTGKLILKLAGAGENTFVDRFTPDGRYVVTRDENSDTVGLWDPRTGKLVRALRGPEARIVTIDLSASGHRLLAGAADQTVRMWDTETGTLLFFADISTLRTEDVPIPAGAAKVLVRLHPSGEQALAELIAGQQEPGLLFDLPDHRGIEDVVDAAYAAVPYRFTEEERAEQELDLFGRPDPKAADLEELTVKVPF